MAREEQEHPNEGKYFRICLYRMKNNLNFHTIFLYLNEFVSCYISDNIQLIKKNKIFSYTNERAILSTDFVYVYDAIKALKTKLPLPAQIFSDAESMR